MGILRLAHVDLRVPDLDLATAYYTEVLGLQAVERDDSNVWLKCWDEVDHHSLRLRYANRNGLDLFSFKVEEADDLAALERRGGGHRPPPGQGLGGGEGGPRAAVRLAAPP